MLASRIISVLLVGQGLQTVAGVDSRYVRSASKAVNARGEIEDVLAVDEAGLLEDTQGTQRLLDEVEQLVESKDPAARDKIKEIMNIVEKLFPDMESDRDDEKTQVGINLNAITECNAKSTNQQQSIKTSTEKQVGSERGVHASCRETEKDKESHKNGRCGELDTFLKATNTPSEEPKGRDAMVKWVEDMNTYWCPQGPRVTELDEACKTAEKEHQEHKAGCDKKQYTFELGFCTWRTELMDECDSLSTCYEGAVDVYNKHKAITEDLIKKWKIEWKSLKKIRCYVDVWMNDQDAKTVDASQYEKCKGLEPDTSVMNIDFGKVPAKTSCDLAPVKTHPGTSEFPPTEYAAFSKYAVEPIACLEKTPVTSGPEVEPTTTTAAPATTAAPTTTTAATTTSDAPWFCVASITANKVTGPFADIESAKQELNKKVGSSSNRQMICEMSKDGAKEDPHVVGGQQQGGGAAKGFNKWWSGWGEIATMNKMCNDDTDCAEQREETQKAADEFSKVGDGYCICSGSNIYNRKYVSVATSLEDVKKACKADAKCSGFTFAPHGYDIIPSSGTFTHSGTCGYGPPARAAGIHAGWSCWKKV